MDEQKTVLAYGETLWDLLPTGSVLGGAPFNFACRVNSLGDRGLIVSRLGRDDLGKEALDQIVALGMDTTYMQWDDDKPTGSVRITLDENSNPSYYIVPGVAYDNIELTDELLEVAAEVDCFCYGTLVQRMPVARRTLEQVLEASGDGLKLADINLRKDCYSPETVRLSLQEGDILKLNEDEARELGEMLDIGAAEIPEFCKRTMERWGLSHVLVTFGERGTYVASAEGEQVYAPGYKVDLVDPCGSGDAFTAGFIHKFLRGRPLAECCELANAMGAIVASQKGATAPISRDEIEAFMASGHERIYEECMRSFSRT